MTDMKCPFCNSELERVYSRPFQLICAKCGSLGTDELWQELIDTKKTLEQSETCCTEWEKQALDYKAENIALSGDLERTRKALDVANEKLKHCVNMTVEELDELKGNLLIAWNALSHFSKDPIANDALKKITTLKQKD